MVLKPNGFAKPYYFSQGSSKGPVSSVVLLRGLPWPGFIFFLEKVRKKNVRGCPKKKPPWRKIYSSPLQTVWHPSSRFRKFPGQFYGLPREQKKKNIFWLPNGKPKKHFFSFSFFFLLLRAATRNFRCQVLLPGPPPPHPGTFLEASPALLPGVLS